MPSASRDDGEHSGSTRSSASACAAGWARWGRRSQVAGWIGATSSSAKRVADQELRGVDGQRDAHEMVERSRRTWTSVSGGSASPSTMAAMREATSSPRLPRSAMRLAPCSRSRMPGRMV